MFGDPPESGNYNAHGQFLPALERELGVTMRWLGTPGAFSHYLTHLNRASPPARFLEFDSYAQRYAAAGFPTYLPADWQPYYPWSLAWRTDDTNPLTAAMLEIALGESRRRGWLTRELAAGARPWVPADEPVHASVFGYSADPVDIGR